MDLRVGTADGQSLGLKVLGLEELWAMYLEGMERSYWLTPLVVQGLSHCVNLLLTFLQAHSLSITCTEEEVLLMPIQDGLTSSARLVERGCQAFRERKSGKILNTSQGQEISPQAWKILPKNARVNTMFEMNEEIIGVYIQQDYNIPSGMGKYIPLQTS